MVVLRSGYGTDPWRAKCFALEINKNRGFLAKFESRVDSDDFTIEPTDFLKLTLQELRNLNGEITVPEWVPGGNAPTPCFQGMHVRLIEIKRENGGVAFRCRIVHSLE